MFFDEEGYQCICNLSYFMVVEFVELLLELFFNFCFGCFFKVDGIYFGVYVQNVKSIVVEIFKVVCFLVGSYQVFEYVFKYIIDVNGKVFIGKSIVVFFVDCFLLNVYYVIVFQQLFMNIEVVFFYFFLCLFNRFGYYRVLNDFVFFVAYVVYQFGNVFGLEEVYEVVFQ